jgi:hypothetical protein
MNAPETIAHDARACQIMEGLEIPSLKKSKILIPGRPLLIRNARVCGGIGPGFQTFVLLRSVQCTYL